MNEGKKASIYQNPLFYGWLITAIVVSFITFLSFGQICELDGMVCQTRLQNFLTSQPNEMGDTLAGIAGTLAFLWIIVTVLLQRKELMLQRREMESNRKELTKTNIAHARQLFETTFFSMLRLQTSIVEGIDIQKSNGQIITGRDCFSFFYREFKAQFQNSGIDHDQIDRAYQRFWIKRQSDLSHYFRSLYRTFLFLDTSEHAEKYHAKLLRAQLSDQELALLFYNSLSDLGKNFIPLAEKYAIFDNLSKTLLVDEKHADLMRPSAFGEDVSTEEVA